MSRYELVLTDEEDYQQAHDDLMAYFDAHPDERDAYYQEREEADRRFFANPPDMSTYFNKND